MSNVSQERCCCPMRHSLSCVIPKLIRAKNGNKAITVQQYIQRMEMVLSELRQHLKIKSLSFGHVLVIEGICSTYVSHFKIYSEVEKKI